MESQVNGPKNMFKNYLKNSHIYRLLRSSRYYDYITLNRDAWIKQLAKSIPPGREVLDVGAGSCPYREHFSHCVYKTQDFALLDGEQLRDGEYGRIDYCSEITAIPVANGSFDVIVCTEVLEHVPEPILAVREFGRILRANGVLILSAPLGSGIHQAPFHYYGGYTPFWYDKFLKDAGFRDVVVVANGGFFKMFGWQCIRFLRLLSKSIGEMPWYLKVPIALFGLICSFMFYPLILICAILDIYDHDKDFTAGYHVTAIKV